MGIFSIVSKVIFKSFFFLMLFLSLSVLAWIATFSSETAKSFLPRRAKPQIFLWGDKLNSETTEPDQLNTPIEKVECPQVSPLLSKYTELLVKEVINDILFYSCVAS